MNELKPCPFCGSNEVINTSKPEPDQNGCYSWVCPECIAVGGVGESAEEATVAWNNRPSFSTVDGKQLVSEEAIKYLHDNYPEAYKAFYDKL